MSKRKKRQKKKDDLVTFLRGLSFAKNTPLRLERSQDFDRAIAL